MGFRWVKPAASLKLGIPAVETPNRPASFRWVKPAASLKREWGQARIARGRPGFRWVKPAASLKPEAQAPVRFSHCSRVSAG